MHEEREVIHYKGNASLEITSVSIKKAADCMVQLSAQIVHRKDIEGQII